MSKTKQTPLKSLKKIELTDGFGESVFLDIAPTMKTITHGGKTYFRSEGIRAILPDGEEAATYLWDGYRDEFLRRMKSGELTR